MRIKEIDVSMKKKEHSLLMIKILSYFINDYEVQNKVKYTSDIFNELNKNLQLYKKYHSEISQSENAQCEFLHCESIPSGTILYNYLDNDDVIYEQAIDEMKEEIYAYYNVQSILIFDNLTNIELVSFYNKIKELPKTELSKLIHSKIELNVLEINQFITDINNEYLKEIDEKDLKFIPTTIKKNPQIDIMVSSTFYLSLFQDMKKTLKYLTIEYQKLEIYQKMLEIYLLIIIDNNMKRR